MSPKRKEQTSTVTFRIPAQLHAAAMARAEERGDNVSQLLREFVQRYVEGAEDEPH